jgi:hypothetical protein
MPDYNLDSFYKATVDKKREPYKYYKVESQAFHQSGWQFI